MKSPNGSVVVRQLEFPCGCGYAGDFLAWYCSGKTATPATPQQSIEKRGAVVFPPTVSDGPSSSCSLHRALNGRMIGACPGRECALCMATTPRPARDLISHWINKASFVRHAPTCVGNGAIPSRVPSPRGWLHHPAAPSAFPIPPKMLGLGCRCPWGHPGPFLCCSVVHRDVLERGEGGNQGGKGGGAGRCLSGGGRGEGVHGREGGRGSRGGSPPPPAGMNHIDQELQKCDPFSIYICHNV